MWFKYRIKTSASNGEWKWEHLPFDLPKDNGQLQEIKGYLEDYSSARWCSQSEHYRGIDVEYQEDGLAPAVEIAAKVAEVISQIKNLKVAQKYFEDQLASLKGHP